MQWEYKLLRNWRLDADMLALLEEVGLEGWELATGLSMAEGVCLILKRPRPTEYAHFHRYPVTELADFEPEGTPTTRLDPDDTRRIG